MSETAATRYKQTIGLAGQAADDLHAPRRAVRGGRGGIEVRDRGAEAESETQRHADRW